MKLSKFQRARIRWTHDRRARARGGFWLMLLLFIAMELLRPKPKIENARPSGLGEFRFTTATEGRTIPLVWGTLRIEGSNVVWYGDLLQEAISEKIKTGLFSSQVVITGFRYHVGVQSVFCLGPFDGPHDGLRRVWIGDDLVGDYTGGIVTHDTTFTIDKPELFGGEDLGQGGVVGTFRFFGGTSTQSPSLYLGGRGANSAVPSDVGSGYAVNDVLTEDGDGVASVRASFLITAVSAIAPVGGVISVERISGGLYSQASTNPSATTVSPGGGTGCTLNVTYSSPRQSQTGPAIGYRDLAYIVPDIDSTLVGTSTNLKPWKYEVRRIPNGLSLTGGHEIIDGGANPANVLFEILTNADWGYGIPSANIDTAVFSTVGDTLFDEGNGFSFLLDSPIDLGELVNMIERQIDGVLFQNPLTGEWRVKLIRDDFDIDLVPEANATSILDIRSFSRSTWEGTTNQVRVPFNDEGDEYKDTFGFAQDMANVLIVGKNVSTTISHPGVKVGALANSIADRELRVLATPLAQSVLVVDRSFYGILPGDPFAFTDADIGFTKLPMRVKSVDYGDLLNGKITIEALQDVFLAAAGTFDPPPPSGWEPPGNVLVAYPADEAFVFEAPRGLTLRDPLSPVPETDKLYAHARRQSNEVVFDIRERHSAGTPSGAYSTIGQVYQFQLMGELLSSMNLSGTNPLTSITIVPEPDTQAAINAAFPTVADAGELGTVLTSLCLVDDEFFLVSSSQTSVGNVQLNAVYRGVLDSVQVDHAAGAKVYMIFVGAGISDTALPPGDNVEVLLIPRSSAGSLAEGSAPVLSLTMDNRTRRPYPPAAFDLNGTTLDTTNVDLDGSGSGEDVGVLIDDVIRRDFRTPDEIASLFTDAAAIDATFPAANSTEVEFEVRNGAAVLDSELAVVGTAATMRQLDILAVLDTTTLPSSLTFAVRQSHTFDGVVYKSRTWLEVTATIASPLIGKHAFGELDDGVISNTFVVVAPTIDHVFNLSTSFTAGDVEYRINGGSWVTLITAGGTGPGTIPNASLSASDTIEVRHLSTDTTPQKLLTMTVSGVAEAYAVLIS